VRARTLLPPLLCCFVYRVAEAHLPTSTLMVRRRMCTRVKGWRCLRLIEYACTGLMYNHTGTHTNYLCTIMYNDVEHSCFIRR